jgi:hypothetical protein
VVNTSQVDNNRSFAQAGAAGTVASTAHTDGQLVLDGKLEGRLDIRCILAEDEECRLAIMETSVVILLDR